jgi:hypothetical protein
MVLVKKYKIECPVRYELGKVDRWRVVSCFYMRFGYDRLKVDPGASFLVFSELEIKGLILLLIIINNYYANIV